MNRCGMDSPAAARVKRSRELNPEDWIENVHAFPLLPPALEGEWARDARRLELMAYGSSFTRVSAVAVGGSWRATTEIWWNSMVPPPVKLRREAPPCLSSVPTQWI